MSFFTALKCKNPTFVKGRVLPCRVCPHCLRKRYFEWSLRCRHELLWHKEKALFFTLTYCDEKLERTALRPMSKYDALGTLNPQHTSDFISRFRKYCERKLKKKVTYIYCGEYGPVTSRPHYHFIVFGVDHNDISKKLLTRLWSYGHVDISRRPVTDKAIMYTVGYIRKKMVSLKAKKEYDLNHRYPPFQRQSQGLGGRYALAHLDEWSKTLTFSYRGFNLPVPRFYQQLVYALEGCRVKFLQRTCYPDGKTKEYFYYKTFKNLNGKYTHDIISMQARNLMTLKSQLNSFKDDYQLDFDFKPYFDSVEYMFYKQLYDSYSNFLKYNDINIFDFNFVGRLRDKYKSPKEPNNLNAFQDYFGDEVFNICHEVASAHNYDIENGCYGKRNLIDSLELSRLTAS